MILLGSGSIVQLMAFFAVVYLARILGPADFGKINFAGAFMVYVSLATSFGLPIIGTRLVAGDIERTGEYLGHILTLRMVLALLGLMCLLTITYLLNLSTEIKYLIVLYALGLLPGALYPDWAFQGMERMGSIGWGNILKAGIYLVLILLFVDSSRHLLVIPCFNVLGSLIATIVLLYLFTTRFEKPVFRFDPAAWKGIMRQGLSMGFALMVTQVFFNIDIVMLGFLSGEQDVGYYSAAYKIILFVSMIRNTYAQAMYPAATRYYKTSMESWRHLLELSTKLMATIIIPVAIGGTILAGPIMGWIYGPLYDSGIIAFQILIWNAALIGINISYVRGLLSCGQEDRYARVVTVAALFNIAANSILIPQFGLKGAAVATLITQAMVFIGVYRAFNRIAQIAFGRFLVKPLIASIIMAVLLTGGIRYAHMNLLPLIAGGVITYFAAFLLLKGTTIAEIAWMTKSALKDSPGEVRI